jgi:hypothetical protein
MSALVREAGTAVTNGTCPAAVRLLDEHELDELLLAVAEVIRYQAQIARRYTLTNAERRVVVEGAVALALGTGFAELSAIGAIGVLVDVTGGSDEMVVAASLTRVMSSFEPRELVLASIALLAGWMVEIARLVELPLGGLARLLMTLDPGTQDSCDRGVAAGRVTLPRHRGDCRVRVVDGERPLGVESRRGRSSHLRHHRLLPALPRRTSP